jgi:TonB-dependent SusC/RagA subfamily outer membrane receptor
MPGHQIAACASTATAALVVALATPLGAQAPGSGAVDTVRAQLAPVTIGFSAATRSIGSSRHSVDSSDVHRGVRPRTLSELLQARIPGVSVLRHGGDPSDGSRIRVRGTTSLVGDAAPIVVIDGVPAATPELLGSTDSDNPSSRFDDFDPEEIERVDVLAGPAATTLFGAGASNGAVVITTKRGTTGRPRWNAWMHGDQSSEPTSYPANYHMNGTNPSTGAAATSCDVVAIASQQCVPTTLDSWSPLESASPFRSGQYGAGGASISGGPFGIKAYASAAGRAETAVLEDSWAGRINGRLNAERELFGRLTIGGSLGYVSRHATTRSDNVIARGLLGAATDDVNRGYQPLPNNTTTETTGRDGDRWSRSARVDWRALTWLRVHGIVGRDEVTQHDLARYPAFATGGAPFVSTTDHWLASNIIHGTVEAQHRLGSSIGLRTVVSYEETDRKTVEEKVFTDGSTGASEMSTTLTSTRGWMVQERLDVGNRIFLNVGARRVTDSAFGTDVDSRWHPSIDAAWDLGRIPGVSSLRVRGAYAVGVQPRDTLVTFIFVAPPPFGSPSAAIEPEQPRESEIGLVAEFGRRVAVDATFFTAETPKLIVPNVVAPPSLGGLAGAALGRMHNRGLEAVVRFRLVDRPTTKWTATTTLATLRNRVSGLDALPPAIYSGAGIRNEQPFGTFVRPRITFVDTNGDGLPSPSELTIDNYVPAGTVVPTREISLRSELGLRHWGLTLQAALDHRGGHRAYNTPGYYQCGLGRNCPALQDPSVSLFTKIEGVASAYRFDRAVHVESASYTRFGELALEWRPRVGRVTVIAEARNLVTWTRFNGPDPEIATTASATSGLSLLRPLPALPRTLGVRLEVGY